MTQLNRKYQHNYAMFIDTSLCVACSACVYACKAENNVPQGYCRDWVVQTVTGNFPDLTMLNRSERCQHCEDAPCVSNCPTGASYHAADGTVQINRDYCTGCKACLAACPYDARYIHPDGYADKCTFCQHRLEQGLDPACVTVCPTSCLEIVDLNSQDINYLAKGKKFKQDKLDAGTHPKLFWLE